MGDMSLPRLDTVGHGAGPEEPEEGQNQHQSQSQGHGVDDSPAAAPSAAPAVAAVQDGKGSGAAREEYRPAPVVHDGVRRTRPKSAPSQRISASQVRLSLCYLSL